MFRFVFMACIALLFFTRDGLAQELIATPGTIEVIQDEKLTQLAEQYRKMSANNAEIDGYRVQIFFDSGSNSKNKAASVKDEFETLYPEAKSYLSYKEPYYRVRVGNFRSLIEAVGFQKKIATDYPNSFPVKDKIVQ
jgi:hypothetical protein